MDITESSARVRGTRVAVRITSTLHARGVGYAEECGLSVQEATEQLLEAAFKRREAWVRYQEARQGKAPKRRRAKGAS